MNCKETNLKECERCFASLYDHAFIEKYSIFCEDNQCIIEDYVHEIDYVIVNNNMWKNGLLYIINI